MWFDADAALKEIRCVKGSNARRIVVEAELGWISTNSTISTATFLKYENTNYQGNDKGKSYDAVKTLFHEYYFLDKFSPNAWR